jgi:uncharacterized protein
MRSYRTPKVELRPSRRHGVGAFAIAPIERDEIVGIRAGDVVSRQEAMRRDRELGGFSMQIDAEFFLCPADAADVEETALFFNHCCEPNVGIRHQITFVAMKEIKIGDELSIDYAMNVSHPYQMSCECGTPRCRGVVTGDDWRLPDLQESYSGYFDAVITTLIEQDQ